MEKSLTCTIASLSGTLCSAKAGVGVPRPGLSAGAESKLPVWSPQVEGEKQQEHELQRLCEHLAMLLGALLEAKHLSLGCREAGGWEAGTLGPGPELFKAAELLRRCEALERKTATFENIVCVLNREVERVAMTAEACGRQHRLDQDRIEALSNKVCAWGQGGGLRARTLGTAS